MHLAEHIQWNITAMLLWGFEILPATNTDMGEEEELDLDAFEDGLSQHPKPYKVRFKIRSEAHAETITRIAKEAESFLQQFEEI